MLLRVVEFPVLVSLHSEPCGCYPAVPAYSRVTLAPVDTVDRIENPSERRVGRGAEWIRALSSCVPTKPAGQVDASGQRRPGRNRLPIPARVCHHTNSLSGPASWPAIRPPKAPILVVPKRLA